MKYDKHLWQMGTALMLLLASPQYEAWAQKNPKVRNQLVQLQQQLQQAQQESLPKSEAEIAKKLIGITQEQHLFPLLLEYTQSYHDAQERISGQPSEALYTDLDKLSRLPWLRPEDKAYIAYVQLETYLNAYTHWVWSTPRALSRVNIEDASISSVIPTQWTAKQYDQKIGALLQTIFGDAKTQIKPSDYFLRQSTDKRNNWLNHQEPTFAQWDKLSLALKLNYKVGQLVDNSPRASELTSVRQLSKRYLSPALEQLLQSNPSDQEKMHIAFAQLSQGRILSDIQEISSSQIARYAELINTYQTSSGIGYYMEQLAQYYKSQNQQRKAFDLLTSALKNPQIKEERKAIETLRQDLLRTDWSIQSPKTIIGSRKQTLALRTRMVDEIVVEYWRRPQINANTQEWTPSAKDTPYLTKRIKIKEGDRLQWQEENVEIEHPSNGTYVMRISYVPSANAVEDKEEISQLRKTFSSFQITNTYLLGLDAGRQTADEIQLLDALTGSPIVGAKVSVAPSNSSRSKEKSKAGATELTTNTYGSITGLRGEVFYHRTATEDPLWWLYYSSKESLAKDAIIRIGSFDKEECRQKLLVYTDRMVYRPGDELHFYGNLREIGRHSEQAKALGSKQISITLKSPAGQLATQTLVVETDRFGRFSGSIKLTEAIVQQLGGYTIEASLTGEKKTQHAYATAWVEEYKRADAELTMQAPPKDLSLGKSIEWQGIAKTYSGAPIAGARVQYSLHGEAHYYTGEWGFHNSQDQDLASGEVTTDSQGRFVLPLSLKDIEVWSADANKPIEDKEYIYTIKVSLSDGSGRNIETVETLELGDALLDINISGESLVNKLSPKAEFLFTQERSSTQKRSANTLSYQLLSPSGKVVLQGKTSTDKPLNIGGQLKDLPSGKYQLKVFGQSLFGTPRQKVKDLILFSPEDKNLETFSSIPLMAQRAQATYSEKEPAVAYYLTPLPKAHLFYEVRYEGGRISYGILRPEAGRLGKLILPTPKDDKAEELSVELYMVYEGKLYREHLSYEREQPHKTLELQTLSFRDRTSPNQKETLSFRLTHLGKPVEAGVGAWMYDASIDEIRPYQISGWDAVRIPPYLRALHISPLLSDTPENILWNRPEMYAPVMLRGAHPQAKVTNMSLRSAGLMMEADEAPISAMAQQSETSSPSEGLRKDFGSSAFFLPQLTTDKEGKVSWTYTVPDRLSRWKLILMANTTNMDTYTGEKTLTVQKELMVQPNIPRFVREGDQISLYTSVRNLGSSPLDGTLSLELFDPKTQQRLTAQEQALHIGATSSSSYSFAMPKSYSTDSVGIRIWAKTAKYSDGEEHRIPVLPEVVPVVVSQAFTLNSNTPQEERLSLFPKGTAPKQGVLDLRVESNPLYLALQSLPTLYNYQSTNAISLASALYSQSIGAEIAQTPGIKRWIEEREQELSKGIRANRDSLLMTPTSKTPWAEMLHGEDEGKRTQEVLNFLSNTAHQEEHTALLTKLAKLQGADGRWSWFEGMRGNDYITRYIMRLLVRQQHISKSSKTRAFELMMERGWKALDQMMEHRMQEIKKHPKGHYFAPSLALDYLYMLELYPQAKTSKNKAVREFFEQQLASKALSLPLYDKPVAALVLAKNHRALSTKLLNSLREHLTTDEQGTYFAQIGSAYYWVNRSYEMTTSTIEALSLLSPEDKKTIAGLQQWLLGQKRAVRWESDIATTEAIYALLLGTGKNTLNTVNTTQVVLTQEGGKTTTAQGERISLRVDFDANSLPTKLRLSSKESAQVWANATAHYPILQQAIRPSGKELKVVRKLYLQKVEGGEVTLKPLSDKQALRIGDVLVTQLHIEVDRDMDFVAVSDPRLGLAEPESQLSGYTYGGGTYYYIEPRDQVTNFYFDRLSRGSYTLSYSQQVVRAGTYQAVSASLQSIYAPEYTAQSGYSGEVKVSQ